MSHGMHTQVQDLTQAQMQILAGEMAKVTKETGQLHMTAEQFKALGFKPVVGINPQHIEKMKSQGMKPEEIAEKVQEMQKAVAEQQECQKGCCSNKAPMVAAPPPPAAATRRRRGRRRCRRRRRRPRRRKRSRRRGRTPYRSAR